ncbi:anthranilate synthase component II [Pontibacter akesuensis]|uniref:Anthranilate synthase, component II n=1 Tax=Pontibacter akesuensis TaxID=388950 RepID=A0A1I7IID6_9BACT|nr:aminodeoxychorismate/anthranilate synthase component II [Pontibacter akesuensis]GHA67347.1 aminodeoxychorismate/anthranilate synthase component II [Pontibacter akesuensis]SFU72685.1 anthranilate synthase, component II [Pontibacter akesuensis]
MLLLLDNFDSFTYNLVDYFGRLGVEVEVVRNDVPLQELQKLPIEAIVLSPGPGTPQAAGSMMDVIRHYHEKVPMLGICLGHQALGEFFGAKLEKGLRPMHGKISKITCTDDAIFEGLPQQMPVVRYHSLVLQHTPESILPLAHTQEGELMAFRHKSLPLYALQFHPEAALTTYGLHMLRNWVSIANIAHRFGH